MDYGRKLSYTFGYISWGWGGGLGRGKIEDEQLKIDYESTSLTVGGELPQGFSRPSSGTT